MSIQVPDRYQPFFEASLQEWAPGCKYALIRSLDSGRSPAVVYVIDIAGQSGRPVGLSGQYILKLQDMASLWELQTEYERHQVAMERNPVFTAKHIPRLVQHAKDAERIGILYEIAGHSLATVVAADTVQAGAIQHYGREITRQLLTHFNSQYEVELEVSPQTAQIANVRAYSLGGLLGTYGRTSAWHEAYDVDAAYGMRGVTPTSLADLHRREESAPSLRRALGRNAASNGIARLVTELDWRSSWCAETGLTRDAFVACRSR